MLFLLIPALLRQAQKGFFRFDEKRLYKFWLL